MRFEYTDGSSHDFIALCRELDEFLNEYADGEENRAEYVPYNRPDDIHGVVLAYDGDIPVGCAAFKKYDDECAEVKRVFVKQEYRGGWNRMYFFATVRKCMCRQNGKRQFWNFSRKRGVLFMKRKLPPL